MKASLLIGLGLLLNLTTHAAQVSLADAVEKGESFQIQALLSKDIDVNDPQIDGMTALHWAANHNDAELANVLLDRGANAAAENRYGITPLYLACLNGNAKLVRHLLDAGADPNAAINGGETALLTAARTGKIGAVKALIEAGADVEAKERNGQTAMMWAAAQGHVEVVQALIEVGADFLTPLKSGYTPFLFAIREGQTEVVDLFLAAGANANGAMYFGKSANNKGPMNGTSPLILAVENGHYDLAIDLLDAGANPNDQRTGYTVLHTLTWIRKPDIGESASGAPPPKGSGKRNSEQFVRELVARGADVNAPISRGRRAGRGRVSTIGATPFFMAADRADLPYMKLLLELGADPFTRNEDGCTALLVAAGIGSTAPEEEAGSEMECVAAVKFLLSLGAEINTVDANGETAMHGAAYKNAPAVARYLHEQGANIRIWNTNNDNERTPLLIAEGYRPGNFKPSFATVDAITEIMLSEGVKPPTGPKPKHSNYNN
ncbi:MAG: ankyrin repeat domain-containing protein [Verrucomicrobia bacterium]|nr:ankyrin repeat domain-containing protein [Verrucomicrobiota bacterium]